MREFTYDKDKRKTLECIPNISIGDWFSFDAMVELDGEFLLVFTSEKYKDKEFHIPVLEECYNKIKGE
jgi:hypothetical protein